MKFNNKSETIIIALSTYIMIKFDFKLKYKNRK